MTALSQPPLRLIPCACSCDPQDHDRYTSSIHCWRCGKAVCPFYRPARMRWWQFWRPRMRVPDSLAGLTAEIPIRRES